MYVGPQAEDMTPAQRLDEAAHAMARISEELWADVHNPGLCAVPIKMYALSPNVAAVMIICCREALIAYTMFDKVGVRVQVPPSAVERLLGEGNKFDIQPIVFPHM